MSQLGMQMPGSQRGLRPRINVYTGLALAAVACLIAAVVMVGRAGMMVGPADEKPIMRTVKVHPKAGAVKLPD